MLVPLLFALVFPHHFWLGTKFFASRGESSPPNPYLDHMGERLLAHYSSILVGYMGYFQHSRHLSHTV
jgi:hypothetical protein